ncbi:asparagine synthase-related protein [Paucidesulfovibrio longus]|uniref:asparagine synthase-related protein n=1 Tax=Paucidesulfovibrio longus TaxID=889 RepID=UPI0003B6F099|nr:asparagine synthetase B family protein [Paucidesulfovibrio longus]
MTERVDLRKREWARAEMEGRACRTSGWAFDGGTHLAGEALAKHVLGRLCRGVEFPKVMDGLNGHFAVTYQAGDALWLGADAIRSIPLFYRRDAGAIESVRPWASDDVKTLLRREHPLVADSVAEFATAGYVTGQNTLYEGVCGVQAGECVRLDRSGARSESYDAHLCTYDMDDEGPEALAAFDEIVLASMRRALRSFNGRQVALPLSGGLDSRLLAVALKRLGHDNVVCFAYGLAGNHEARKSREVAETLDLPWFEVPYTPEGLREDYHGAAMREFWAYAHDGTALPCITEWPAIRMVAEHSGPFRTTRGNIVLDKDAVFLSGQSGDFINGSHLRYLFFPELCADPSLVEQAILDKHYSLWGDLLRRSRVREALKRRIRAVLEDANARSLPADGDAGHAARYEYWECRERQVKYVIGGARVFEFFGRDWAMPLWDREVMEFFRRLSIPLKLRGYFYAKYAAAHDPWGVFQDVVPERFDRRAELERFQARQAKSGKRAERLLESLPLLGAALRYRKRVREHRHYYRYNALGFPQVVGRREYVYHHPHKRHVLSLWLRDVLREEYGVDLHAL